MTTKKPRTRLTAHTALDGSIRGIVVQPEGDVSAHLVPEPGIHVAEITEHAFQRKVDHEKILELGKTYKVDFTPAEGKLVRKPRSKK